MSFLTEFMQGYLIVWKLFLVSAGSLLILIEITKYSPENASIMTVFIAIGLILWLILQGIKMSNESMSKARKVTKHD